MTTAQPRLEVRGLAKSFFGVRVLHEVSFEAHGGRVLGIIGENGSGKSTTMNLLTGVLPTDGGTILLDGRPFTPRSRRDSDAAGIAFIQQELNIFPNLSVAENLFLLHPPRRFTSLPFVSRSRLNANARALLRKVDLDVSPATLAGVMSAGERQLLEIARGLSDDASIFIFDEPTSSLTSPEAARLLSIGLANYAAGAMLMPYEAFRQEARRVRHDIDRLRRPFGASFEQACHRLSTLQRPDARGTPFFFCRVDMAGNITKRHSATRFQFARFGGACPLWIMHEAVAIPDRILTQIGQMPDGVRYASIAKGLVKESGSYARSPRRYAVALGCEISEAEDFVYADHLDLGRADAATPIGVSCRICPREDCDQRAFPPAGRAIRVDPERREVVPYRFE